MAGRVGPGRAGGMGDGLECLIANGKWAHNEVCLDEANETRSRLGNLFPKIVI